jgi:hypothetical protein
MHTDIFNSQIIFEKSSNSNGHITQQSSTQIRVAMWIIFGSGRNVYVVEENFQIHSTPINLKIKVQQD